MPQARHGRVFGKRETQHTIIIASGDRIRHFSFRPWQAGAVVACACLFFLTYVAATAYLFMRDDLIRAARAEQARVTRSYEERIAALRAQVDRARSQQLVAQQKIEDSIGQLYRRQMVLTAASRTARAAARPRPRGRARLRATFPCPEPRPAEEAASASPALSAIEAVTGRAPDRRGLQPRSSLVNAFLAD